MPGFSGPGEQVKRSSPNATVVKQSADKYNVPEWVLYGVWGMETNFGANVKTSSAGAIGNFQFLPSTASGYHYPLTNSPSALQFQQQADGAAHYLSDLYKQYGSWDQALLHYSGGGYGEDQVKGKASTGGVAADPIGGPSLIDSATDAIPGVSEVKDVGEAVGKFYDFLTSIDTWIRIGEAIAGLVLVYFGLRTLTGGGSNG